jgi:hypothetical protein
MWRCDNQHCNAWWPKDVNDFHRIYEAFQVSNEILTAEVNSKNTAQIQGS